MNIAVIGLGGVGGFFGGKIAHHFGTDRTSENDTRVHFIARNDHLREILEYGLILDADEGKFICNPASASERIEDLPQIDFCLICVKSYDLENVLIRLKPKIREHTVIMPLLNGVDIVERVRKVIHKGAVLPSCVYIGAYVDKPGTVVQRGPLHTIHTGADPLNKNADISAVKNLLNACGIDCVWHDNPLGEIWKKYILVASFALVTARYDKSFGEILQSDELSRITRDIMKEIYDIGISKKIPLSESIITGSLEKCRAFPFDTKTSFQRDFAIRTKPDERDIFGEAIIRLGKEAGVKTDITESIQDYIERVKPRSAV